MRIKIRDRQNKSYVVKKETHFTVGNDGPEFVMVTPIRKTKAGTALRYVKGPYDRQYPLGKPFKTTKRDKKLDKKISSSLKKHGLL